MHEHVCAWLDGLSYTYGEAWSAVGWSGSRHKNGRMVLSFNIKSVYGGPTAMINVTKLQGLVMA